MAGLFFCLASAEGAGLLFFPGGVSATRKRLQLLFCPTPKASTGLYSSVSVNLTHSSAHNTANTQAAYTPPAPRWRAYHQTLHPHRYQIPAPHRDAIQASTAAYYNKVYKGAPLLWIHARQYSTSQIMPARRGQLLHMYRVSPAGGAEPLTATAVSLFGLSPDS